MKKVLAFSLVETLIVVAIVTILAGIAVTTFGRVQKSARITTCLSNLSQLGSASLLYSSDNDDQLPHYSLHKPSELAIDKGEQPAIQAEQRPAEWKLALMPYVKEDRIFFCPLDAAHWNKTPHPKADKDVILPGNTEDIRWKETTYQTWWGLGQKGYSDGMGGLRIHSVKDMANTMYLSDPFFQKDTIAAGEYPFYSLHGVDNLEVNVLYLDGHVKRTRLDQ